MLSIFSYFYQPFGHLFAFSEYLFRSLPIFLFALYFVHLFIFDIELSSSLYILDINNCQMYGVKYCLPFHRMPFYSVVSFVVQSFSLM